MKKRIIIGLTIVLCLALCASMLIACSDKGNEEQDVEPAKTIMIANANELIAAGAYVGAKYANYTLNITQDIDLSDVEWEPIGRTLSKAFCGTLNGNGHTIRGLKITGWNESGVPQDKGIAKRIIGWVDGQPKYASYDIVDLVKGGDYSEEEVIINDIVHQGDNNDPEYANVEENGEFETSASFGSMGLFGYIANAEIKNLTIENANISFYTSGEYAYAGPLAGYAVASTIENVNTKSCDIAVANIYKQVIEYSHVYGVPSGVKFENETTVYVGGLIGYAKANTVVDSEGKYTVKQTVLNNVTCEDFDFDNAKYAAYQDAGLKIAGESEATGTLVTNKDMELEYAVESIDYQTAVNNTHYLSELLYMGGVVGYADNTRINKVAVNGVNKTEKNGRQLVKSGNHYIMAKTVYLGGAVGVAYNSELEGLTVEDVTLNSMEWRFWQEDKYYGLVDKKAVVGGAVALQVGSSLKEAEVKNNYYAIGGSGNLTSVTVGGAVGYMHDRSEANEVKVDGLYAYSSYYGAGSDELSSVLAGAVGVVRDSNVTNASVKNAEFEISGQAKTSYKYTKGIVSQVYGDSSVNNSQANSIYSYFSKVDRQEMADVNPVQYKNNIVNEDGYASVKLYYDVNGKHSGVYVTVYGEVVPVDEFGNQLRETTIYKKIDLSAQYKDGDQIDYRNKGYYYYNTENKRYNEITSSVSEENQKFRADRLYAEKINVYKISVVKDSVGKSIPTNTIYEYDKETAQYALTNDKIYVEGKDYYREIGSFSANAYNLNITVYSESNKVIVVEKDGDNEVLAKAIYTLSKDEVEKSTNTVQCGDKTYTLAASEIYLSKYFEHGVGFKADKDGFTIKYYDPNTENRDFSKYVFVSERPNVDSGTLTYGE